MAAARILIVDDEPSVLRLLKLALETPAWTIETAPSAEAALSRPREPAIDLYLVDKNLPGASGLGLVRELRLRGDDAGVILMTGYASASTATDALNLGIDAYLEKPFANVFEVGNVVRRGLEARQRRRRVAAALAPKGDQGFLSMRVLVAFRSVEGRAQVAVSIDRRDEVVQAASRRELIDALRDGGIDVLILEGVVGVAELVEEVRAASRGLPCVLVGERLPLPLIRRLIDLEVRSFVDLPLTAAEGRARLDQAIERCRGRKLIRELSR